MDTKVKICGITNIEDALHASECGADALGFILYRRSPRFIDPDRAASIIRELPPFVTTVGVFVDESPETVNTLAREVGFGVVQLHGNESPGECTAVEARVVKAVRIRDTHSLNGLGSYSGVSAFLLDTYRQGVPGGTGESFDWDIAVEAKGYGRIILSGGLNPENIREAVICVRPYGVDVSSGVEIEPGRKDHRKVAEFISRVRSIKDV